MHLFNRKTIRRYRDGIAVNAAHSEILAEWAEMIRSGRILSLKETALHGEFTSKIVQGVLGYKGASSGSDYTVSAEQSILQGSADLALGRFGGQAAEIVAPFELKGATTRDLDAIMPGRNKSPVQQAWEYAINARGVKWVLVSNYVELRLYGFGEGTDAYEVFHLEKLTEPDEYARFMLLLSERSLLSGRTQQILEESRREDRDITDKLYSDYKEQRYRLIEQVRKAAPAISELDSIAIAQTILDRVLFIAFAEDNGLLPSNTLANAFDTRNQYNPQPVWQNFLGLFKAIDQGNEALNIPRYNGGLFKPDGMIEALVLPDTVCAGFKRLGEYDFASEVSVTVLGHIFEQSISDVERLQAIARGEEEEPEKTSGTSGRRKRDGVVYTPDYVARFIVAETLGTHLDEIFSGILRDHARKDADPGDYENIPWKRKTAELEAWEAYRDRLKTLRIVDPACGSGVFLIMAFDFMKAELTRVNEKIKDLLPSAEYTGDLLNFVPDSEILTHNLFGVDVNAESVEITKLSLWIKTARRGKVLDSLSANIRVGDSLIEDANYAYLEHGFDWASAFPQIMQDEGGFDIVLGNPPYVRQELFKELKPWLERRFESYHGVADLYCYFFERGLRLLKPGGRLGYISSNTFFKTGSGKPLREYLLREATIESVVDFGDLQVFAGVTTYPAIVTMKKGQPGKGHALDFWKLDSLPEANFRAAWEKAAGPYPQSALGSGSWELENPKLRALREKIIENKRTLLQTYEKPFRGVTTGRNEAFVIDQKTRDELVVQDASSEAIIKPWVEGKDLKRWHKVWRNQWIIFARQGLDLAKHPAISDHLAKYRELLEPKPENWRPSREGDKWLGRKSGNYRWSEIQDKTAYWAKFSNEKVISTKISSRPTFSIDRSGSVLSNTAYMIDAGQDNEFLTSLLNSKLASFYFRSIFVVKSGGFFEIQPDGLKTFPIPEASPTEKASLSNLTRTLETKAEERLNLQSAFTRRIADLCPPEREAKLTTKLKDWWKLPDFSAFRAEVKKAFKTDIPLAERSDWEDWMTRDRAEILRLDAEIKAKEAGIDAIVYDLFDLTEEEIALLEAAIS